MSEDLTKLDTDTLQARHAALTRELRAVEAALEPRGGLWLVDYPGRTVTPSGGNKIRVIKAIREITGLGLRETKDLVESVLPVLIAPGTRSSIMARNSFTRWALEDLEQCATVEWRVGGAS